MLEQLKAKNPGLRVFSVDSEEFRSYGRIVTDLDTTQILEAAQAIQNPESGASYVPEEKAFAQLPIAKTIRDQYFGTLPTQIGYCWGHNQLLDATEWHTSSEINIAVTPLVLLLAHRWEIADGKLDSAAFKAFYLPKGSAVEVYATSLHFTPCQVSDSGFGCVVALPSGTNVPLETASSDPLLFRQNKWLICHEENQTLMDRGVVSGITGCNHRVAY